MLFCVFSAQAWGCMSIIPALGKLRQEELRFQSSLGYILRSCVKKCMSSDSEGVIPISDIRRVSRSVQNKMFLLSPTQVAMTAGVPSSPTTP
jgi:hypothetical protein